ncbi:major facilitator superfamily domain-containing protein [Aspergillus pseudocaelatus]|uniref:Major facilitator superfamily domain-containing protein n=1 Tax=Aspergillus pseudocaelatus TaxID=1825620 RepID=A0ABQ6WAW9_9EURO|nr:major facilitator superfamily domain-containing protein [Aspergillus pseudocaelatus]
MLHLQDSQRFALSVFALSLTCLTSALSATTVSNALPAIVGDLGASDTEAFWVGTSFLLCSTVFQPSFAIFSHVFGRRPLFVTAFLFYIVGSALAAGASNFDVLLAARSLQGAGGGGLITLSEILIVDLAPLRERGKWLGLISLMWAVGSVSGPLVGGALAHRGRWRWIFALNLPPACLSLGVIYATVNHKSGASELKQAIYRVDWIGFGLFIPSMTSLLVPVSWGGEMFPWSSWHTLVPLFLGVLGLIIFASYEIWVAPRPFLLRSIFRDRNAKVIYFQTFFHGIVVLAMFYYLPLYYQAVKGYAPVMSGVALLPMMCPMSISAGLVGVAMTISGRYRWALWTGWVFTTTGVGLLYLLNANCPIFRWVLISLVCGIGMGSLFTSMNLAIQANTAENEQSHALGFFAFFRTLGQTIGVAIGGSIFHNIFEKNLPADPGILDLTKGGRIDAEPLVEVEKALPESDPRKAKIIHAYVEALRMIWIVLCAFSAASLLTSFFTKAYTLGTGAGRSVSLDTEHGHLDPPDVGNEKADRAESGESGPQNVGLDSRKEDED